MEPHKVWLVYLLICRLIGGMQTTKCAMCLVGGRMSIYKNVYVAVQCSI